MSKKGLYILIMVISLISYGWLFFNFYSQSTASSVPTVCIFKQITTLPCPACGTTRSVITIANGEIAEAVMINPLGILAFLLLIISPLWVFKDVVRNESSFYIFYISIEKIIQKKYVASVFIAAILANWVWNIIKEL